MDAPAFTDQRGILANGGKSLIYHSAPFDKDTDLAGFFQLKAFSAIDRPDTDLTAAVYDIAPDGSSVLLAGDAIRARYRESPRAAKLATPGRIERYQFDSFTFAARRVAKAHRLRLVIGPADSPGAQKNYNSGGDVSDGEGRAHGERVAVPRRRPPERTVRSGRENEVAGADVRMSDGLSLPADRHGAPSQLRSHVAGNELGRGYLFLPLALFSASFRARFLLPSV